MKGKKNPKAATGLTTAKKIAKTAQDNKAENVRILDVRGLAGYTDYLVICEAGSDRHARALSDHILETLGEDSIVPFATEGDDSGTWILLDYSDVMAHIFLHDTCKFYDLDGLWSDAKKVTGWEKWSKEDKPIKTQSANKRKSSTSKAGKKTRISP